MFAPSNENTTKMENGKIAVVALEINKNDKEGYKNYESLPAKKQIQIIQERIHILCKELQEKEPDSMWIIAWREYGITDGKSRSLSFEDKELLKQAMLELTTRYPNLVILTGPVATHKPVEMSKLKDVEKIYQEEPFVQIIRKQEAKEANELANDMETDEQIKRHELKIAQLREQPKENNPDESAYVGTNQMFCIQGKNVQRHDKTAPIDEILAEDPLSTFTVFQPGKGKNANPFFELKHPITGETILVGAETCRENNFNLLQKTAPGQPLLHFIFSDEVRLNVDTMHGQFGTIQLDSIVRPRMILAKPSTGREEISTYRSNLFSDNGSLVGPLEPLYPFENRILDSLNTAIKSFPSDHPKHKILQQIKMEFLETTDSFTGLPIYNCLLENIKQYKEVLCVEEPTPPMSILTKLKYSLLSAKVTPANPGVNMKVFLASLEAAAKAERLRYPGYKDICSQQEAPIIQGPQKPSKKF